MEADGRMARAAQEGADPAAQGASKLQTNLNGIRNMKRAPDAVFVIDTNREAIAIHEARRLDIPVVGTLDTNCDPDDVDYGIPANDDAIRSVRLLAELHRRRGHRRRGRAGDGCRHGRRRSAPKRSSKWPPRPRPRPPPRPLRRRLRSPRLPPPPPSRRHELETRGRPHLSRCGRIEAVPLLWRGSASRPIPSAAHRAWRCKRKEFTVADITASMVKELREMTGAGMMECKKALVEAEGDLDKAVDVLRTRGLAAVAKKAGRATNEGTVMAIVSDDATSGAVVELNCETDFVGMNDKFKAYAEKIAKAALAAKPADLEALKAADAEGETV